MVSGKQSLISCFQGTVKQLQEDHPSIVTQTIRCLNYKCQQQHSWSMWSHKICESLIYHLNRIRLQLLQPSTAIALNITVYPDFPNDVSASIKRQRHVATSGPYDDSIAGVSTPQVTIGVGKYFIIPSTYKPGTEVGFRMLVYSSIPSIQIQLAGQGCVAEPIDNWILGPRDSWLLGRRS